MARTRRRQLATFLSTLWLASQASCVDTLPRTQIMAIADAEPITREMAATLEVVVKGGSGREGSLRTERFLRDFAGGESGIGWPRQVAIGPLDDDATRVFEYVATVRNESDEEISRVRAIGDFVAEETLMLLMVFQDSCLGRICPEEETCRDGECVSAFIDTSMLPPYDPDDVPTLDDLDAGVAPDGGTPDVGDGDTDDTMTGTPSCEVDNGGCDVLVECRVVSRAIDCGACPLGYEGDGESGCMDVDECATDNGGCDAMVSCTNMSGTFQCGDCPTGFTGGGDSGCNDLNECETDNGGCDGLTVCTNTPGSRSCGDCPGGYVGDGESGCADIDECETDNGGCDALTSCTNTAGSRTCSACPAGYGGSGEDGCTNIDECLTDNGGCDTLTTCSDTIGSRDCGVCPGGYDGDGDSGCSPEVPSVTLSGFQLDSAFDPDTHAYTAEYYDWRSTVQVSAPLSAGQTLVVNGVELTDAELPYDVEVLEGDTVIEIGIREAGRPEQTYTFTVTRRDGGNTLGRDFGETFTPTPGDEFARYISSDSGAIAFGIPREDSHASIVGIDPETDNLGTDTGMVLVKRCNDDCRRTGTPPAQWTEIKPAVIDDGDQFGSSVWIDGDVLAVGAPLEDSTDGSDAANDAGSFNGAAYVFRYADGTWSQEAYVKPQVIDDGDTFGEAVAISGDWLFVGAPQEDSDPLLGPADDSIYNSGAVYVFERDSGSGLWTQQQVLKADNAGSGDMFGSALALHGDRLVVGAAEEGSANGGVNPDGSDDSLTAAGAAYVFQLNTGSGQWEQEAYLKAPNPGSADDSGEDPGDFFGRSLDLWGDVLVVGAPGESSDAQSVGGDWTNDNAGRSGAAYVFRRDPSSGWAFEAYLKASDAASGDQFGYAVSARGEALLIGSWRADAAYIFRYDGSTWVETDILQAGGDGSQFGAAVEWIPNGALIGDRNDDLWQLSGPR